MNIGGIDLNLMLALDALLREANVTRAAERLNLTQPTLSASLARLRKHFDDELLRRNGNQLELTPLAVRLRPLAEEATASARRLFGAHMNIDPRVSTRRFTIVSSDYGLNVLGAPWSALISEAAPGMRLAFTNIEAERFDPPETRMRDVDGILAPQGLLPSHIPHLDVVEDRWVVVADAGNRQLGPAPSLEELRAASWVTALEGPRRIPSGMQRREWAAMASRIAVSVNAFSAIIPCVRGTSRIALMQERLVRALDPAGQLRIIEPPLTGEPIRLSFWWHPSFDTDPEHIWLRKQLARLRSSSALQTAKVRRGAQPAGGAA